MGGSMRWVGAALAALACWVASAAVASAFEAEPGDDQGQRDQPARAAEAVAKDQGGQAKAKAKDDWRRALSEYYQDSGREPPRPFVPLRPATVEDRRRLEAIQLYVAARALEDDRRWTDAADLLRKAAELDPGSLAILRRLSRLYLGALAQPDRAIEFGRKVLAIDPGDTETLARMIDFYLRPDHSDTAAAVALLQHVLGDPKLRAHAPGRLLAEFELGQIQADRLQQFDKAAEAYAHVLEDLDDKSANRLSPADLARIVGNDPGRRYREFATVFIAAHRDDLAVRALERGLVYDPENPQIALLLAETLLRTRQAQRALAMVESLVRRQPQGVEPYELLKKVLTSLGRQGEITGRLEEAAKRDSKNVSLQYVLADHYREIGKTEKAEELYKALLATQPTPRTYAALATSLLKRKKAGDLLKVLCEAVLHPSARQAVAPQIQLVASDDAMAEAVLDAGFERLSADPPTVPSKTALPILKGIANADRPPASKNRRLEKLLKIERLEIERAPSELLFVETADTQRRLGRFDEAAATLERMIERYPAQNNVRNLAFLAEFQDRAGKKDAARATLERARKLDAGDADAQSKLASVLGKLGQIDEAVAILEGIVKREPNNPIYELTLGQTLLQFNRNEQAVKVFQNMLKRYAENDQVLRFVRSSLSVVYVNMGDYSKGESELEQLLERNPDDAGPNNDLGYLYAEQGKHLDKAEAMIRKALREEPDNFAYLDSMGWVLFKRGKPKEALESLIKAAAMMKAQVEEGSRADDPTIFEHLGDVYFQLHEIERAEASWRKALKAAEGSVPPDRRAGAIRKKLGSLRDLAPTPRPSTGQSP